MAVYMPIAAAGPEGLFWVIVIIATIVSRIMKARREVPDRDPSAPAGAGTDPAEELKQFLRSLSGEPPQPPQPPPPPPPAAVPAPRLAAPVARAQPKVHASQATRPQGPPPIPRVSRPLTVVAPPSPPPLPPPPTPSPVPHVAADEAPLTIYGPEQGNAARFVRKLAGKGTLKAAILLREVLGPPVAMRSGDPSAT